MQKDHLAKEADRLINDQVLIQALDDIRADALNALAAANVDDKTAILKLQSKVAVVDEFRTVLGRFIVGAETETDDASPYA